MELALAACALLIISHLALLVILLIDEWALSCWPDLLFPVGMAGEVIAFILAVLALIEAAS